MPNFDIPFLDVLKGRQLGVVKDGVAHLAGGEFAVLNDSGKAFFADPGATKVESDGTVMRHRFRITSPALDRAGDVVVPDGVMKFVDPGADVLVRYIDRYAANPVVFLNHFSMGLPIARSQTPAGEFALAVRDDAIFADAYFHGKTEESEKCYELVDLGYLSSASIGFRPIKAELMPAPERPKSRDDVRFQYFPGLKFTEWELLEWSIVGVPCNPDARMSMNSWMSKNFAKGDTAFSLSLKAMLMHDAAAKSTTVVVPEGVPAPEPVAPVVEAGIVKLTDADRLAPFTGGEVEAAIKSAVASLVPPPEPVPAPEPVAPTEKTAYPEEHPTPTPEPVEVESTDPDPTAADRVKMDELDELTGVLRAKIAALDERLAKLDGLPPPPAPSAPVTGPEPVDVPEAPLGAKTLLRLLKFVTDAMDHVASKRPLIEHAKTGPFLDETCSAMGDVCKSVSKFGAKHYPEHFGDSGKSMAPEVETVIVPAVAVWSDEQIRALIDVVARLRAANDAAVRGLYALTGKKS